MRKRPSSLDVARLSGVSQTTVSFVLSGKSTKTISAETQARVMQAAKDLGYRPNRLANGLLRGKTQTIGVVAPRIDHSFNANILQGIEEVCAAADHRVLVANNQHKPEIERQQVELLLDHRVDGVVWLSDEATIDRVRDWLDPLRATGTPVAIIDDRSMAEEVDCFVTDDIAGSRLATEHLLSQGHRRIALIAGSKRTTSAQDRLAGYQEALAQAGIAPDDELVRGGLYDMRNLEGDLDALFALPCPPTAAVFASDALAARALMELRHRGVCVPEEFAVVGYADMEFALWLDLTTIRQDAIELGRRAAERLMHRIQEPHLPAEMFTVPVHLTVRRSSVVGK